MPSDPYALHEQQLLSHSLHMRYARLRPDIMDITDIILIFLPRFLMDIPSIRYKLVIPLSQPREDV